MKEITPYLNFDGNCREAMTFYHQCLGGELFTMTFAEAKMEPPPGAKDRLVHARLKHGPTVLMASDTMPGMPLQRSNDVWLNIICDTDAEVDTLYALLVEGGAPTMPPNDAFWDARFAMLTDRFGVNWMFNHERVKHT